MNNHAARLSAPGSTTPTINRITSILLAATLLLCIVTGASGATRYVNVNNPAPAAPYTDWSTAANSIQDAVDAAVDGETVLVTNGVYKTGGRVVVGSTTNRLAVTKPLTVASVNGPGVTMILGHQVPGTTNGTGAIRCVYLTNNAVLMGFTLTNGATQTLGINTKLSGGAVYCESTNAFVSNCLLAGNSAYSSGGGCYRGTISNCTLIGNSSAGGGGAFWSTMYGCTLIGNSAANGGGAIGFQSGSLNNCLFSGNSASQNGGGALNGTLNNCILIGNSASQEGGGFYGEPLGGVYSPLNNCTIVGNSAGYIGGGASFASLYNSVAYYNSINSASPGVTNTWFCTSINSCTVPLPPGSVRTFTNAPLFVNLAAGDLHLLGISPCINAGLNFLAPPGPDFDGNSRISGGTVDIGAYEFQNPASVLSYAWLAQYNLPNDGSADFVDSDGDGMNNSQEWLAGTAPTDANSLLKLFPPTITATNVLIRWTSVPQFSYYLQRTTNLGDPNSFTTLVTNFYSGSDTTPFVDTNGPASTPVYYRVGVSGVWSWLQ